MVLFIESIQIKGDLTDEKINFSILRITSNYRLLRNCFCRRAASHQLSGSAYRYKSTTYIFSNIVL